MRYAMVVTALAIVLSCSISAPASAQDPGWSPPSIEMPMMPRAEEQRGNWLQPRSDWFAGVQAVSGVSPAALRMSGSARRGSAHLQIARFTDGPLPIVIWSDRNGDDRSDIIEIYRSGGLVIQLIDADYNGRADVLRVYDGSGSLLRAERF